MVPVMHGSAVIPGIFPAVTVDGRRLHGGTVVASIPVTQAPEMGHRLSPLSLTVPAGRRAAGRGRSAAISPVTGVGLNRSHRVSVSVGMWGTTGDTVVRFIPGPVGR
jgi:NTE family protein